MRDPKLSPVDTGLRPVPMGLFPTLGTLQEVFDLVHIQVPVTHRNQVTALLATYHNTLLNILSQEQNRR